jgi:hypothetical protein
MSLAGEDKIGTVIGFLNGLAKDGFIGKSPPTEHSIAMAYSNDPGTQPGGQTNLISKKPE